MIPKESEEVRALYAGVEQILDTEDDSGRKVGDCKHGVYLFYDYDGEPIYVGQTREKLRVRIRRHLTNQRTDAVAMRVLDPFEVAEIEMWPFWYLTDCPKDQVTDTLDRAEYMVYCQAVGGSEFKVVLNEAEVAQAAIINMPSSVRKAILTKAERKGREHPDIRLARRARTIAELARIISERKVKIGIRKTLWAQAARLERLARKRLRDLGGSEEEVIGPRRRSGETGQQRAEVRRQRASARPRQLQRTNWNRICRLLLAHWSPEQVAGHLQLCQVLLASPSWIYRLVQRDRAAGGTDSFFLLQRGQRRRQLAAKTQAGTIGCAALPELTAVSERP